MHLFIFISYIFSFIFIDFPLKYACLSVEEKDPPFMPKKGKKKKKIVRKIAVIGSGF